MEFRQKGEENSKVDFMIHTSRGSRPCVIPSPQLNVSGIYDLSPPNGICKGDETYVIMLPQFL